MSRARRDRIAAKRRLRKFVRCFARTHNLPVLRGRDMSEWKFTVIVPPEDPGFALARERLVEFQQELFADMAGKMVKKGMRYSSARADLIAQAAMWGQPLIDARQYVTGLSIAVHAP